MKHTLLIICISAFFLASCEKDYLTTADQSTPVDPTVPISFKTAINPIFTTNCLGSGCHVTGGATPTLTADKAYEQLTLLGYVDADTPDTIPTNSKLYQRIVATSKPMPPNGKLSAGNIKAIALWIQQGAKNN